ncbi:TetR/AcrR family transcriptional regulator [Kineococcus sp. SYSU DK001]|uniref:TetR/AcrR family transcriptional regulator n=1 Tax=Kineococcus sp. SYSU DK001 TaxID=3383122 RepID=UPI003D7E8B10
MPRVKQDHKGDRRAEVLRAARTAFVRDGGAAFSVRAVAKDLGISLGHLQHFFPTRQDLLFGMLDFTTAQYWATYDAFVTVPGDSPERRFHRVVDYFVRDAEDPEVAGFFVEFWSLTARDPQARARLQTLYDRNQRELAHCIAAVRPDLSGDRVGELAAQSVMVIDGYIVHGFSADTSRVRAGAVRAGVAALLLGMVEAAGADR